MIGRGVVHREQFPVFPVLPAQRDGQTADSSPFALDFT